MLAFCRVCVKADVQERKRRKRLKLPTETELEKTRAKERFQKGLKRCSICGEVKQLSEFSKHNIMTDGYATRCRACRAQYHVDNLEACTKNSRDYCASHMGEILKRHKVNKEKAPEKLRARAALRYAVDTGRIKRPEICEVCGKQHVKIHGHHTSYAEKDQLNVMWLCATCHAKIHAELRRVEDVN